MAANRISFTTPGARSSAGRTVYDGIYRGGRRPIDLYYRVHSGIKGAGMTVYKDIKNAVEAGRNVVDMEQSMQFEKTDPIWDMVNYLPTPRLPGIAARSCASDFKIKLPE